MTEKDISLYSFLSMGVEADSPHSTAMMTMDQPVGDTGKHSPRWAQKHRHFTVNYNEKPKYLSSKWLSEEGEKKCTTTAQHKATTHTSTASSCKTLNTTNCWQTISKVNFAAYIFTSALNQLIWGHSFCLSVHTRGNMENVTLPLLCPSSLLCVWPDMQKSAEMSALINQTRAFKEQRMEE